MSANVETITMNDGTVRTTVTNEDGTENLTYLKVEETFTLKWERIEGVPMRMGAYESVERALEVKADPVQRIPQDAVVIRVITREVTERVEEIIA